MSNRTPDDQPTLKERAFPIIYILAKSMTYLLMLAGALGICIGVWAIWVALHMTRAPR